MPMTLPTPPPSSASRKKRLNLNSCNWYIRQLFSSSSLLLSLSNDCKVDQSSKINNSNNQYKQISQGELFLVRRQNRRWMFLSIDFRSSGFGSGTMQYCCFYSPSTCSPLKTATDLCSSLKLYVFSLILSLHQTDILLQILLSLPFVWILLACHMTFTTVIDAEQPQGYQNSSKFDAAVAWISFSNRYSLFFSWFWWCIARPRFCLCPSISCSIVA